MFFNSSPEKRKSELASWAKKYKIEALQNIESIEMKLPTCTPNNPPTSSPPSGREAASAQAAVASQPQGYGDLPITHH